MATPNDVLWVGSRDLGYYAPNDPEAGSKYGRWMADLTGEEWLRGPSTEVWWCCMYVSWCLNQAGQECPGFPSYNTDLVLSANPPLVSLEDTAPGDVVIWNWDGGGTDHVGIVAEHIPGGLGRLVCLEGNYRNSVATVDRSDTWGLIAAVIRPPYGSTDYPMPEEQDSAVYRDYLHDIAAYVIEGEYGNGADRVRNIYDDVQRTVNYGIMSGDIEGWKDDANCLQAFAYDVAQGLYGNYPERMYNVYKAVQDVVNERLING